MEFKTKLFRNAIEIVWTFEEYGKRQVPKNDTAVEYQGHEEKGQN